MERKSSVQEMLSRDFTKKNKDDLVLLLSNFSELIGKDEYQKISGVNPQGELEKLTKKELVAIINSFNENYNPKWEESLANASVGMMKDIFNQIESDEALFDVMDADGGFNAELGAIDFENLIGGPMQAAIKAQNSASLSTVAFIKEVGFENDKIRMVNFSYKKDNADGTSEKVDIVVPFVSILNIPSLRIETLDIDFNVKLNSTFTKDVSSELGINASLGINYSVVKFKTSVAYKRTSSSGIKVEKEYSMNVKVRATNDEIPAGLEKVLGMMTA